MKIRSLGTELFHVDRQTDRLDEANSRFSQNMRTCLKTGKTGHRQEEIKDRKKEKSV
jgi:hypothetical protein